MHEYFDEGAIARLGTDDPRNPIWHPFTPAPFPGPRTFFTRASGAHVWDHEGRRYLDATSSWWCITHGHCHPKLVAAMQDQAATLDHVMLSPHVHGPAWDLASRLVDKLGKPFTRIFYSDDGSTAVEAALKLSVQYFQNRGEKKRLRFLSLERGYHGDTLGAVSVSHVGQFHHWFEGLLPRALSVPAGDLDAVDRVLDEHGSEIAALIVEPLVLAAGGMQFYAKEFLEKLVDKARAKGCLVIFDEVFTGFGRTGLWFAKDAVSVAPDVLCLSKGLTGGMLPLGVTAVTDAVFDAFRGGPRNAFFHGHTFTGNPISTRVALENLKIFDEEKTLSKVRGLAQVMEPWVERFRPQSRVLHVRQLGGIFAVDLKEAPGVPWKIARRLWDQGFWIRPLNQLLYVLPPYCTDPAELDQCLGALHAAIADESLFEGVPL